jgi:hypothetical protein
MTLPPSDASPASHAAQHRDPRPLTGTSLLTSTNQPQNTSTDRILVDDSALVVD